MISNVGKIIKAKRISKGYSIEELSHRSGVSAKTIQRLENDLTNPRGFTLQKIADALDIDIEILTNSFKQLNSIDQLNETGIDELKKMNLSVLVMIVIPLTNLFFPILYFTKYKRLYLVQKYGSRIVSFQLIWSIITALFLILAPFIRVSLNIVFITSFGSILFTYLLFWFLNLSITIKIALQLSKEDFRFIEKLPNVF
ncbi:helix-turn-helix domain-containing protein [Polaribacter sp. MED152]|uniref:helix-turn-helix domain-containing protein n=1 Tax=Polaribacter sp. MED152 TaxID=313598 RepID=UPI000068C8AE|nr:helix-turn-helix transcriptional regulator [Polaribacter sp. MED152]EAQ42436.1 DNA binding helix-turn helix protein [Polaribacter sp. MED152]